MEKQSREASNFSELGQKIMENYIVVGSTQNANGFQRQNKTHELDI